MGWYFGMNNTKQSIIDECLQISDEFVLLSHSLRENNLWLAVEHKETKNRLISLCLLCYDRRTKGYGYKPLDEMAGPCYYNCPLSFLELVPDNTAYANMNWRTKVREYWGNR